MAPTPDLAGESRGPGWPERRSPDAVMLHLEVKRLVVGPQPSRGLALVSPGGLEDATNRLALGVFRRRLGELPQRGAQRRQLSRAGRRRAGVGLEEREVLGLDHVRSEKDG